MKYFKVVDEKEDSWIILDGDPLFDLLNGMPFDSHVIMVPSTYLTPWATRGILSRPPGHIPQAGTVALQDKKMIELIREEVYHYLREANAQPKRPYSPGRVFIQEPEHNKPGDNGEGDRQWDGIPDGVDAESS